jgi:hypothetical protein
MVPSVATENIPSDTTGDRSRDPPTSSAVTEPLRYSRLHQWPYIHTKGHWNMRMSVYWKYKGVGGGGQKAVCHVGRRRGHVFVLLTVYVEREVSVDLFVTWQALSIILQWLARGLNCCVLRLCNDMAVTTKSQIFISRCSLFVPSTSVLLNWTEYAPHNQ